MLIAKTTRDLNQAARAAAKYLKEQGIELPHGKALDLIARTAGVATHMQAQAALAEAGLRTPLKIATFADLQAALHHLTPQQLAMSVSVSEGCDDNGNAEFYSGCELMRADSAHIEAASDGVLEPEQPVLVFNGPDAADAGVNYDEADQDWAPRKDSGVLPAVSALQDLCRILSNKGVDTVLHQEGLSDAAYDALAAAAPFVGAQVLATFDRDALQRVYDKLPTTATPEECLEGQGNWGLHEDEAALATQVARLLVPSAESQQAEAKARIKAQFEMATGSGWPKVFPTWVELFGVTEAVSQLNQYYGTDLAIGPYLISSEQEQGYWCNRFGWTTSKLAATGYPDTTAPVHAMASDAQYVDFKLARDF